MEGNGYCLYRRVVVRPRPQPPQACRASTGSWLRVGRQSFISRRAFEEHQARQARPSSSVAWPLGRLLAALAFILNIWQPRAWKG
jgi:hypothetical protein